MVSFGFVSPAVARTWKGYGSIVRLALDIAQVLTVLLVLMKEDRLTVVDGYNCGLGVVFGMIGGKWKAVILWRLSEQPHRFGELKRQLPGISERILINQLREMQRDGLITRQDFQEVPPRVEYSITSLGRTLNDALCPLSEWGLQHEQLPAGRPT